MIVEVDAPRGARIPDARVSTTDMTEADSDAWRADVSRRFVNR
jgi:hypothetical protein